MRDNLFIGIDIGGTKIAAGLVSSEGQILARSRTLTEVGDGPDAVIERIVDMVARLRQGAPHPVAALGVCSPGPVDSKRGIVICPPNMIGWVNIPLADILRERTGLLTRLDHDAKTAALAEYRYGAGRGVDDMIYITVSTGVGGGLIIGGQVHHGVSDAAGEVGHFTIDRHGPLCSCGKRGCVEAFAAGPAIARSAREAIAAGEPSLISQLVEGQLGAITAETVNAAAQQGDALARRILENAGEALGIGIATVANIVNPRRAIIGGGVSKAGELLLAPARRAVRAWAVPPAAESLEIVLAALGDDVGVLGAALLGQMAWEEANA